MRRLPIPGLLSGPSTRCGLLKDASWPVRSARTASQATPGAVRQQGGLWSNIEANALLFNPRKLPSLLVPAARLAEGEKNDPRLNQLLQRATAYVQNGGVVVPPVLGARGVATLIQACRQLRTPEAKTFSLALLGAVSAQVPQLNSLSLCHLTQELADSRIRDEQLWRSIMDSVQKHADLLPKDIAILLVRLPRSAELGGKPSATMQWLCQQAIHRCQEFASRDLVHALGALCRSYNFLLPTEMAKAIHLLTDQWLALQPANLETTPPRQVISLSVSLASAPALVRNQLRMDNFLTVVPRWAQLIAVPSSAITAEEGCVLLWAFKNLAELGLSRYPELVQLTLGRLEKEANFQEWSRLRLGQAIEVLLGMQLSAPSSTEEPLLKARALEMELQVAAQLAEELSGAPVVDLQKVVQRGDAGGVAFWVRCAGLTDAVLDRAAAITADEAVPTAAVIGLIDMMVLSGLAKTPAFQSGARSIGDAIARRHGAEEPPLADVLRKLRARQDRRPSAHPEPGSDVSQAPDVEEVVKSKRKRDDTARGSAFEALPALSPTALAERIGKLGRSKSNATEVAVASEALLGILETLPPEDLLVCLSNVLRAGRRRVAKQPTLLEVVERIGDQVAVSVAAFSVPQLIFALDSFAGAGLPYHLLFESSCVELLKRSSSQNISWGQAVGILESCAAVGLWLPELSLFYRRLRRQQELARMPTMGLIRFLSAATDLELTDKAGTDVRELLSRILAETLPERPLPLEETAIILQSLQNSGTVPPEKQLRHLLSWVARTRPSQFTQMQLTVLRQFILFVLAQAEDIQRASMHRMPVEMQTFISEILCNRMENARGGIAEATRRLRSQVTELVVDDPDSVVGVHLGPAGYLDLKVGDTAWLLDGPEAFLRPFTELNYVTQEKSRLLLLQRLLCDEGTRRSVADFYPGAREWPLFSSIKRLSWLQWEETSPQSRRQLLGCQHRTLEGSSPLISAPNGQVGQQAAAAAE